MAAATKARAVGFNHVAIEVGDIGAALAFYGRLFEFHLRSKNDSMAIIDLGDQFLALQKGQPAAEPACPVESYPGSSGDCGGNEGSQVSLRALSSTGGGAEFESSPSYQPPPPARRPGCRSGQRSHEDAAWRERQLSRLARVPACPTSNAVSSFGGASDAMPPLDSIRACAIRSAPGEKYNSKAPPGLPQENIAVFFGSDAETHTFSNAA